MNSIEKKRKISLKGQGKELSEIDKQIEILSNLTEGVIDFNSRLKTINLSPLKTTPLEILQINVGYMCNQVCDHCHVDAGPDRKEIMTKATMQACLDVIDQTDINTVDLTGGAPEMNPDFQWFVEEVSKRKVKVIVRSNLTILVSNKKYEGYFEFFKKHKVEVIASLPCYTEENTDKQRGDGVFTDSIKALKKLNEVGYGMPDSGLMLHLVFNPGGASIAPDQSELELDYKKSLKQQFDIEFNSLFTITNLPISRFLDYLLVIGKYEEYMLKLSDAFNPIAAGNVMCRNTVSVRWDGDLFDCDFNQQLNLPVASKDSKTIFDFNLELLSNRNIVLKQHCYGCTAGAGSSCQGSLV